MRINDLTLKNFRNFSQTSLTFSERLNVFVGENGQGKTNLLEALYFLLLGESFRYGDLETLIQRKMNFGRSAENNELISAQLNLNLTSENGLNFDIHCLVEKKKKNFILNGKPIPISNLKKKFKVILFSPESLAVIKEGSSLRRDLIDDLIQSIFIQGPIIVQKYKKILKTRNRILYDYLQNPQKKHIDVFESIDPLFLEAATDLTQHRIQAIREIQQSYSKVVEGIMHNQGPTAEIRYLISGNEAMGFSTEQVKNCLLNRQVELRNAELQSGTSLVGPHKHDVRFLYGQNDSRFFCSQGQQRTLILAFKMAQIVYHRKVHGEYPVLMLDDVLSELDQQKRESLIKFLRENSAQTFITSTDFNFGNYFSEDLTSVVHFKEGKLCPTNP
jgi:DNA replication and repair protein RecF